eukprot:Seg1849.1 transcript_id=Seg1849.1/GoldUCD/mRNA.D3Y31 product="hypothetical protein" protein_id=Seg1849.1/GoldUCD/D3Y31
MLTDMFLTILTAVVALASSIDASPWTREKLSLFCYTSEQCKDLYFCANYRCRYPTTLSEILTVMKIHNSRQRSIKGKDCSMHFECPSGYLCDFQDGACRRQEEEFQKNNRCNDLKKSCMSDADCSCPGRQMICEQEPSGTENECVFAKNEKLSSSSTRVSSQERNNDSRTMRLSTKR